MVALDGFFRVGEGNRVITAPGKELPEELHPGIDYVAYAQDPDGHLIQLYYYMEQLGWEGKPRPTALRRAVSRDWPETLEPLSDTYVDQVFQGPLG